MNINATLFAATAMALPLAAWADEYRSVPVLKQPVSRGEIIRPENVATTEVPASQVYASTVTEGEALAGMQAQRMLPAGQPLSKLHVRVPPAVARSQAVTLRYVKGGIELTGSGQALEDGALGQSIKVTNPATRTSLMGTVSAAGIVDIN